MKINIIIAGAGFGGLSVANQLRKKFKPNQVQILVIDKKHSFTYYPSVHELISDDSTREDITIDLKSHLSKKNIEFLHDEIISVEPSERSLQTAKKRKLEFDILVVALGSTSNYFGIEGAQKNTIPLKSIMSVEKINQRIKEKIKEKRKADIVICGAGLTGVEGAFAVKELVDKLAGIYDILDKTNVTVVEAMQTILPPFPQRVQKIAEAQMIAKKIDIKKGVPIIRITEKEVELKNGEKIKSDITIWTAGVRANPSLSMFEIELSQKGAIITNDKLQTKKYDCIYALGDNVHFPLDEKRIVPQTAQYAEQQSDIVTANIARQITGKSLIEYNPNQSNPVLISLGTRTAILSRGNLSFKSPIFSKLKKMLERRVMKKYS